MKKMNEALMLALACAAGSGLGAFFFLGLWWTVRRGMGSRWAPLVFLGSLLVRLAVVLGGFYVVSAGRWERLLACLVGFALARFAATLLTRQPVRAAEVAEG